MGRSRAEPQGRAEELLRRHARGEERRRLARRPELARPRRGGGGRGVHRLRPDPEPVQGELELRDPRVPVGFAPIPIGLVLTLIHLISIPVTNTSVNPARSTGPAVYVGGWALGQLWLFWVAPIVGGILGALLYRAIAHEPAKA